MRILVTGRSGQLGKSIHKLIVNSKQIDDFVFVGRKELDLSVESNISHYFDNNQFDIIINCAAYTAVDKAEEEQDIANQVNHLVVKQLAEIANKQQAKLIHISTDYVFDGESDKPYLETDTTNPINIYGKTKLAGEKALQEIMPTNAIIIRTSWVYSEFGSNFVKTMLRLGKGKDEVSVISDQTGSPTYATDLAEVILTIIKSKFFNQKNLLTETYHYSNKGEISWYDFAKEIFKLAKIKCKVNSITTECYQASVQRPKSAPMNSDKIVSIFEVKIHNFRESLNSYIKLKNR